MLLWVVILHLVITILEKFQYNKPAIMCLIPGGFSRSLDYHWKPFRYRRHVINRFLRKHRGQRSRKLESELGRSTYCTRRLEEKVSRSLLLPSGVMNVVWHQKTIFRALPIDSATRNISNFSFRLSTWTQVRFSTIISKCWLNLHCHELFSLPLLRCPVGIQSSTGLQISFPHFWIV